MNADGPAPMLDSKAVSDHLGIPIRTLDQWSHRGVGPVFYKIGRHRRYRLEDVDAWVQQQRCGGGS